MRTLQRGMALSVGLSLGRMLNAVLDLFLGLATVCTIGMFLFGHWAIGSVLFLAANVMHSWLLRLWIGEE